MARGLFGHFRCRVRRVWNHSCSRSNLGSPAYGHWATDRYGCSHISANQHRWADCLIDHRTDSYPNADSYTGSDADTHSYATQSHAHTHTHAHTCSHRSAHGH